MPDLAANGAIPAAPVTQSHAFEEKEDHVADAFSTV